jgi:adenine/guanine phosphoribosyltransferase-like PRPP-binding protein
MYPNQPWLGYELEKKLIEREYPKRNAYQCLTHIAPTINRRTRNEVIEDCVKALKPFDYDTLAFQGASGIGISMILAHLLQKEVILVRKEGEPRQSYAQYKAEGYRDAKRYIIVDDLIASGTTAARIIRGVRGICAVC